MIPLTILTGFLGAGKTTLLNRILTSDHGLRVAVLVNDFGSVNVDAELVVGIEDNVIRLANGCTCCTLRDDLVATVVETINRPERPEYILLEASGVADPGGIVMAFNSPSLAEEIRLDSVACLVDADEVFAYPEQPWVNQLKLLQIAFADMVVLNKVSLAGPAKVNAAHEWIDEHFNDIRVFETDFAEVPDELLLGVGQFDVTRSGLNPDPPVNDEPTVRGTGEPLNLEAIPNAAHPDFDTWTYTTDEPMSLDLLEKSAANLPGTVFRCKGIINSDEYPLRAAALQVVSRRVDVSLLDPWKRTPTTQVVVIAAPGTIDATAMQDIFDACVAELH